MQAIHPSQSFNYKKIISKNAHVLNWYDKFHKYNDTTQTYVRDLDLENVKPQRAGVILYTYHQNNIYFGVGVDTKSKDLTDFGGGIQYKLNKDGNVIRGALREFAEETLEIFKPLYFNDIKDCPVIYDKDNLIIFVQIGLNPLDVSTCFNMKYNQMCMINFFNKVIPHYYKRVHDPEVCEIKWLSLYEFKTSLIVHGTFFTRVRKFLLQAGDITDFI